MVGTNLYKNANLNLINIQNINGTTKNYSEKKENFSGNIVCFGNIAALVLLNVVNLVMNDAPSLTLT